MTILIVDDHPTNLKLLRVILESENYEVVEARDGLDALAVLDEQNIDVVISDILMPNADGYSLCSEIRRNERLQNLPIIIYTASYTSISDEKLAYDFGADQFLRKPASPTELLKAIDASVSSERRKPTRSPEESDVFKQYSERLAEKLEEKNLQLHERTLELHTTNSKLRHMLAHSPAVLYTFRIEGNRISPSIVSDNVERIFGAAPSSITYEWWVKNIHPEDYDRVKVVTKRGIVGDGYSVEYRLRHVDGTYRWIQDNCRLIKDHFGEPLEIIGIWTDITERIEAETALRRSQEQFREMLENVELFAIILDNDGTLTFCNDYFLKMTGWARDEVVGSPWFSRFPARSRSSRRQVFLKRVREGQMPPHYENSILTKDGNVREVIWSNTYLRDANGRVEGVASIGEDVTDRNRATDALRQMNKDLEVRVLERTAALEQTNIELQVAKELAEMANQAKSAFLSRMSHEFRTPMNAILGFGQLLGLTELSDEQKDNVSHILKAGRHLLSLINDVLEISKIEVDTFGISLEPILLNDVIVESITLMRPIADDRQIVVEYSETNLAVKADSQRLRQVLLNLISNAIKYNVESGKVSLRVSDQGKGLISIDVEDTGVGISRVKQRLLFTPFERLGAESKNIEGTGLGLALSKSLTEAMGGKLTFNSTEGSGSVFRVSLPKSEVLPAGSKRSKISIPARSATSGETNRVLVIEDNVINSQLLRKVFAHRSDIELVIVKEGILGLAQAVTQTPQLILLDLHLPDMPGREILLELKESPDLKNIPVIIISADAYSAQRESLLEAGAFRYITKPFELENLIEAVDDGIKESRKRD